MLQEVASNKLAYMIYNPQTEVLTGIYHGISDIELAMEVFGKVEEFSKKNRISGLVADLRKLSGSFMKVMTHLGTEGYPLLIQNGLKAEAIIVSDDLIIRNLSEKLKDMLIGLGLYCEIFSTPESADVWLDHILKKED